MEVEYEVDEDVVGIIGASRFELEDSEKALKEWHKLQNDFSIEFNEFSSKNYEDYEFSDWHYGIKCLNINLYNSKFYTIDFIPKVINILKQNGDSFAQLECYDDNQELIGNFQVYVNKVCFDKMFEENGFIEKLCSRRNEIKLFF